MSTRPTHCIICGEPLPVATSRWMYWWEEATRVLLEPPPICEDVEACMARFHERIRLR